MKQLHSWHLLFVAAALTALTACGGTITLPALPQIQFLQTAQTAVSATPAPQATAQPAQPQATPAAQAPGAVAPTNPAVTTNEEKALEELYARVNPSVVNITVVMKAGADNPQLPPNHPQTPQLPQIPGFPQLPQPSEPRAIPQMAQGSGFVLDTQGHIITNNHVIDGTDKITVTFSDGVEAAATVVGADPDSDIAVIKVDADPSELHPVPLGESDALKVGQSVVAIGNPFGLEGSMTTGIVSGLGRLLADGSQTPDGHRYSIPDIIQTDAAINPGNSGGPLLDLAGNVIGVNTAIESPVRSSSGVGYAVPVDIVKQVVPVLIATGKYEHPFLGVTGTTLGADLAKAMKLDPNQRGVLVVELTEGGPAAKAGLRAGTQETTIDGIPTKIGGDVIASVDGQPIKKFDDLLSYLVRHTSVGQEVTLGILRDGKPMDVRVTLGARPTSK
ncbi:MAG: trypsin-like peptidase domain-containing protein [Chloroflexi bacterium]|nr:trypsin-like peptidase domain-containing protein [Chloroflexota bacterium]